VSAFRKIFEPGRIGPMELKNRLIMAPMGTSSHDREGFIQERTVHYYVERAKGGVGLIIAQSSNALREGQAPGRAGTWDDEFIPGLRRVAEGVHAAGGKIAWQILNHGKLYSAWLDRITHPEDLKIIGPSAIPWVRTGVAPKEATKEDIRRIVEGFGEAARRVKEAGMDAVEIHGAHGYMITQWLSPRDNRRTDEYGGDPKRRARMACEEETTYWQFLPYLMPDGAIVHTAAAIKRVVDVPVIAVGKIWDPRMASREPMERRSPADACPAPARYRASGTICLSFS